MEGWGKGEEKGWGEEGMCLFRNWKDIRKHWEQTSLAKDRGESRWVKVFASQTMTLSHWYTISCVIFSIDAGRARRTNFQWSQWKFSWCLEKSLHIHMTRLNSADWISRHQVSLAKHFVLRQYSVRYWLFIIQMHDLELAKWLSTYMCNSREIHCLFKFSKRTWTPPQYIQMWFHSCSCWCAL